MNKLIFCLISLLHLTIFSQELIFPCFDDHINPYIGIISEMYERADREIQYRDVPSARALHYSSTGHYDGEVIRIAGMETQYPSLIPIPIPVDTIIVSAYGLAESSEEIESVVVIRGRQFIEAATGGFPTVIEVDTVEQMITMVVNGRVDAAVEASRAIQPSIGLMGLT